MSAGSGDNRQQNPRPGGSGWAPSGAQNPGSAAPGQPGSPWSAAPAGPPPNRPASATPYNQPPQRPMSAPAGARPVSAPTQYGAPRPASAPAGPAQGPYPPARQGGPASAPPGYPPASAPGGYGPVSHPGAFNPQQQRQPPIQDPGSGKKKKRSLWDAFMGDLGKSKREERSTFEQGSTGGNYPGGVNYPGGQGGGSSTPLAAFGSLDNRLDMSQAVMHQPPPNFRIEDGVVVPDDARLKKARRRGPGIGGGRWQRFAFLTAMLLAMALLMVLGMSRLIAGVLV
ncbi:MAG TPA: hypothetical protein VHU91_04710, partial [Mycobacteriales bacterium]|nr:hypothetical protein [Mycobacteriales bacterium]